MIVLANRKFTEYNNHYVAAKSCRKIILMTVSALLFSIQFIDAQSNDFYYIMPDTPTSGLEYLFTAPQDTSSADKASTLDDDSASVQYIYIGGNAFISGKEHIYIEQQSKSKTEKTPKSKTKKNDESAALSNMKLKAELLELFFITSSYK
jgi:hypothetical protein